MINLYRVHEIATCYKPFSPFYGMFLNPFIYSFPRVYRRVNATNNKLKKDLLYVRCMTAYTNVAKLVKIFRPFETSGSG